MYKSMDGYLADASAGVASEVGSVPEETRASSAEEANEIPTSANDGAADGAAQSAQAAEEPQQFVFEFVLYRI